MNDATPLALRGRFKEHLSSQFASDLLAHELQLHEVFEASRGKPAPSYPAGLPLFRLDRIYVRGLSIQHGEMHAHHLWNKISDHAALSATLTLS